MTCIKHPATSVFIKEIPDVTETTQSRGRYNTTAVSAQYSVLSAKHYLSFSMSLSPAKGLCVADAFFSTPALTS